MRINFCRRQIPWAMAGVRAALGSVVIAGEACSWNGFTLAGIVIAALVSDIFDGVLARRWGCDTAASAALRLDGRYVFLRVRGDLLCGLGSRWFGGITRGCSWRWWRWRLCALGLDFVVKFGEAGELSLLSGEDVGVGDGDWGGCGVCVGACESAAVCGTGAWDCLRS